MTREGSTLSPFRSLPTLWRQSSRNDFLPLVGKPSILAAAMAAKSMMNCSGVLFLS